MSCATFMAARNMASSVANVSICTPRSRTFASNPKGRAAFWCVQKRARFPILDIDLDARHLVKIGKSQEISGRGIAKPKIQMPQIGMCEQTHVVNTINQARSISRVQNGTPACGELFDWRGSKRKAKTMQGAKPFFSPVRSRGHCCWRVSFVGLARAMST